MTTHILKLCVGAKTIDDLVDWQTHLMKTYDRVFHTTRMVPKRDAEILDDGSIYWVIASQIVVRQKILDIEVFTDRLEKRRCHLILDPELVHTRNKPQRPFQGWRYLLPDAAPADLSAGAEAELEMPEEMRQELAALGLI